MRARARPSRPSRVRRALRPQHRIEQAGKRCSSSSARSRLNRHLPSTRWATTPASRRTRKWCEQVDFATGGRGGRRSAPRPRRAERRSASGPGRSAHAESPGRRRSSMLVGTSGSTAGVYPLLRPPQPGRSRRRGSPTRGSKAAGGLTERAAGTVSSVSAVMAKA